MIEIAVWLGGSMLGLALEMNALMHAIERRAALLASGKNGARSIVASGFVRGAWIGFATNAAYFAIGAVVIALSQNSIVKFSIPLVLIGGMYAMNLRSYLAGRTFDKVARSEEVRIINGNIK